MGFPVLDSSTRILLVFSFLAGLVAILYQVGIVGGILNFAVRFIQGSIRLGFSVWKNLFAGLPWPVLAGIILGVHALIWLDDSRTAEMTFLVGLLLFLIGVSSCLAYLHIDQEREEVQRGYMVLHSPRQGQDLAANLVTYGPRVGLPLLLAAMVAVVSGFALVNYGLYKTVGKDWFYIGLHDHRRRMPGGEPQIVLEKPREEYEDFLVYSLLNLAYAVDLIDVINTYRLTNLNYIQPSRWQTSTMLLLFRSFFMTILLRQLFAYLRYSKQLNDSILDVWSPHEPIQRRAGEHLSRQGTAGILSLLRSMENLKVLRPDQRQLLAGIIVEIGPPALPILARVVQHPNAILREVVLTALGRLDAVEVLPAMVGCEKDESDTVRQCLLEAMEGVFAVGPEVVRKRWFLRGLGGRPKRGWWRRKDIPQADPVELARRVALALAGDRSRGVQVAAVRLLGRLGPVTSETIEPVIALIHDEDEIVRQEIAETLARVEGPTEQAIEALLHLLEDTSLAVRMSACQSLGNYGQSAAAAVPLLMPLLYEREPGLRKAAAETLGRIGTLDKDSLPHLLTGLRSKDSLVRVQATAAIGNIGPAAAAMIPALIEALKDDNDPVRSRSVWALGRMGEAAAPAVPELIRLLENDPDTPLRALAAEALAAIGASARPALPAMLHALKHSNPEVRCRTVAALAILVGPDPSLLAGLSACADDENAAVRRQTLITLASFDPMPATLAEIFVKGLQDPDPLVRAAAINALARPEIQLTNRTALLLQLAQDVHDDVRQALAEGLGQLGEASAEVVITLCQFLRAEVEAIQIAAARSLTRLGEDHDLGAHAVDALIHAATIGNSVVREQSLRALVRLDPNRASMVFMTGLHDSTPEVRRLAAACLLKVEPLPEEVILHLEEGLKDVDTQVRANVAALWARLESIPPDAVPLLADALMEADDGLRLNALRALRSVPVERYLTAMNRLLQDPNENIRFLAAERLLRLDPMHPQASAFFEQMLVADSVRCRRQAIELLGLVGGVTRRYRPFLRERLSREEDPEARNRLQGILDMLDAPTDAEIPADTVR